MKANYRGWDYLSPHKENSVTYFWEKCFAWIAQNALRFQIFLGQSLVRRNTFCRWKSLGRANNGRINSIFQREMVRKRVLLGEWKLDFPQQLQMVKTYLLQIRSSSNRSWKLQRVSFQVQLSSSRRDLILSSYVKRWKETRTRSRYEWRWEQRSFKF